MSSSTMKRKRTTRNSLKASYSSSSSSSSCSQQQQPLSETKLIPTTGALHLPDECWESICTFLIDDDNNRRYLKSLSLVSKKFLSITNHHRSSLTFCTPMLLYTQTLCHRFPNLTSIHITGILGDLNDLLCQISKFPFNLKSLKLSNINKFPTKGLQVLSKKITTLTSLTCFNIASLNAKHFVLISNCFPLLEEFHLWQNSSFHNFQHGLMAMLMALPKFRKINLSCNYGYYYSINDWFLLNLCKNCEFLEEILMLNCPLLTQDGIASAIRERPSLTSLSVSVWSNGSPTNIGSHFIDSLVSLKGLTCLDLSCSQISNELLSSIAMGGLPLRRLVLQYCTGYSYAGLAFLLSKCQHIQHLNLRRTNFLNDQHVVQLSSFIDNLVSINLSECNMLTKLALFALVRECPLLSEIKMENIGSEIVEDSDSLMDFRVYPQLKSLHLANNSWLSDENINTFAFIFPNLQLLDLNSCTDISEEAIGQVLKRCCNIRHLNLSGLNPLRINFVLTLEVLNLSNSGIDDSTLYMISKSCSGLLQFALRNCVDVTEKGVMQVVENCTQLREINLHGCSKVAADVVDSMISIRPSLRKIAAPPNFRCSKSRMKQFLCYGFLVQVENNA
ncbi:hypothetical protein TSUD_177340 [Trifolium subterraneum]|uniref:F-box/LRR-repeat protein 15-like leucin rich repeat domain-containing protein n=1 Tax=Trifolium subterraneum TaxID=3900 RepID=A0A2Z6PHF5_TRISU|nr:hypothetical protein TSUD_177340 [Trifolium subterraneum]